MGRFQKSGRVRRPASDTLGFAARGEREAGQNSTLVLPHHRPLQILIRKLKLQQNEEILHCYEWPADAGSGPDWSNLPGS